MTRVTNFLKTYWVTILIFVFAISIYVVGTETGVLGAFLFPRPNLIWESFQKYYHTLFMGMLYSFALLLPGLLIGTLAAFAIGIPMGLYSKVRRTVHPLIYSINVIPAILLSPFALNLFPSFRAASLFLVSYSCVWATLFATIGGIMTIDKRYLDNAAVLEIKGLKKLLRIVLPAAMPSILAGFTTSIRSAFLVLVFAEMYGSKYGMGYFIQYHSNLGRYEHVWSGFIFMVIVLVIFMLLVEKIKNRMLRWTIA